MGQAVALAVGVPAKTFLKPHRQRTIERMRHEQKVLCIQDGTDLNFNSLAQCKDLGVIGTNQTGASSKGLHLHSTFVVNTDGLPLGVLRADCNAPQAKSERSSPQDKRRVLNAYALKKSSQTMSAR